MGSEPVTNNEAVDRLGLFDTPPEERFDRITRLAQERFNVDYAIVNVVTSDTVFTKSQPDGSHLTYTPLEESFCGEAVRHSSVVEVPDSHADPLFRSRAVVTRLGIRFYAGFPLRTEAGETVGTLCLLDREPRRLTEEERGEFEQFGVWAQAAMRGYDPLATESTEPAPVSPISRVRDIADGDVSVASLSIPFFSVSGDQTGWQHTDHRVVVTLADVMGKGDVAHSYALEIMSALRPLAIEPPLRAVAALEDAVTHSDHRQDAFASLFHAVIDLSTGRVDYVDAGHGLTLLLRADGSRERLSSNNLPFGLRPTDVDWEAEHTRVGHGDVIISVTDGVLDAFDSTLASLDMVGDLWSASADITEFFGKLTDRVERFGTDDDVSAIVVAIA